MNGFTKGGLGVAVSVLSLAVLTGCGTSNSSAASAAGAESASEIALGAAGGAMNASSGGGARALLESRGTCPTLATSYSQSSCSSGSDAITLTYNSCNFGASATWTGSQTVSFSSCPATLAGVKTGNDTLQRTFGSNTARTGVAGVSVSMATGSITSWANATPTSGGTSIAFSNGDGSRTITMNGLELIATLPNGTAQLWNHTITTSTPLTYTASTKELNGTVQVEHNLIKATLQAQFANVTYDPANCGCKPISGTITTTCTADSKSGATCAKFGTETLTITAPASGQTCSAGFTVSSTGSLTSGAGVTHAFSHCF